MLARGRLLRRGWAGSLVVAAILATCVGFPAVAAAAGHAGPALPTISPLPGTPDASPQTQISILAVARRQIVSVHVTGSTTGGHPGRLRSYRDATGASFGLGTP